MRLRAVAAALALGLALAATDGPAPAGAQEPAGVQELAGARAPSAAEATARKALAAVRAPSRRAGATVARIVAPTFARTRLSTPRRGRRVQVQTAWSGQPQILLVLDTAVHGGRGWVKVLLANRPNGSAGWVPYDHVVLDRTRHWVEVELRVRRVTVFRDGRRVRGFRAVVGAPATPTPLGLAAIYERNAQPDPEDLLGPWALSLTSLSNVLESYGGGPGRVAIHGRAGESLLDPLGSARSHGCIRVDNVHVAWMAATVVPGTPVLVRR